jgi:hypothetical protein
LIEQLALLPRVPVQTEPELKLEFQQLELYDFRCNGLFEEARLFCPDPPKARPGRDSLPS